MYKNNPSDDDCIQQLKMNINNNGDWKRCWRRNLLNYQGNMAANIYSLSEKQLKREKKK